MEYLLVILLITSISLIKTKAITVDDPTEVDLSDDSIENTVMEESGYVDDNYNYKMTEGLKYYKRPYAKRLEYTANRDMEHLRTITESDKKYIIDRVKPFVSELVKMRLNKVYQRNESHKTVTSDDTSKGSITEPNKDIVETSTAKADVASNNELDTSMPHDEHLKNLVLAIYSRVKTNKFENLKTDQGEIKPYSLNEIREIRSVKTSDNTNKRLIRVYPLKKDRSIRSINKFGKRSLENSKITSMDNTRTTHESETSTVSTTSTKQITLIKETNWHHGNKSMKNPKAWWLNLDKYRTVPERRQIQTTWTTNNPKLLTKYPINGTNSSDNNPGFLNTYTTTSGKDIKPTTHIENITTKSDKNEVTETEFDYGDDETTPIFVTKTRDKNIDMNFSEANSVAVDKNINKTKTSKANNIEIGTRSETIEATPVHQTVMHKGTKVTVTAKFVLKTTGTEKTYIAKENKNELRSNNSEPNRHKPAHQHHMMITTKRKPNKHLTFKKVSKENITEKVTSTRSKVSLKVWPIHNQKQHITKVMRNNHTTSKSPLKCNKMTELNVKEKTPAQKKTAKSQKKNERKHRKPFHKTNTRAVTDTEPTVTSEMNYEYYVDKRPRKNHYL